MTRTGDREIHSVSGRLPDNPGELAYMRAWEGDLLSQTFYGKYRKSCII